MNITFSIFTTIIGLAVISSFYLAMIIVAELLNVEVSMFEKIFFGVFATLLFWLCYKKIEKFTEQIIGDGDFRSKEGGSLEGDSRQL
jgi:hypothetical protein